jgi:hypothetical protein
VALGKLKSRHVTGTVAFSTPVGDLPGTVETFNEAPNKSRTLMKLDLSAVGVGQVSLDQRFNGETGYVLDSAQGNRDITGPALDNLKAGSFPFGLAFCSFGYRRKKSASRFPEHRRQRRTEFSDASHCIRQIVSFLPGGPSARPAP